jgi:acidic leucine-rich nuclear phosphoprotein 32 family protein A/C/D
MVDAKVLKQIDERIQETEEEIQELSLDELKIPKITNEVKAKLEKIEDLISLSLNKCELESLDNLPNSASLIRLEVCENKFKASEISKIVERYPKLQILMLSDNNITDFPEIKSLSGLKELVQLDLNNTALSKKDGYRKKLFELIPTLEILDDLDKDGNAYEFDDDEEGEDYEEGEEEDSEEEYDEDEDEDEEYDAKAKNRKKTKK